MEIIVSKYYYKKKKSSWTKVLQDTFKEFVHGINKRIISGKCTPKSENTAAKICVIVLMVLTLLFSGIGFYSWVILIMLIIIFQFL
jgi:small-conductance mechanosensitive channel